MKQNLKRQLNIFFRVVFISIITLSFISMLGCGSFKKNLNEKAAINKVDKPDATTIDKKNKNNDKEEDYSLDSYYYYMTAERHRQKGDIPSAIDLLKQAIKIDPDSIYLRKNLIFLYILNKDTHEAIRVAEECNNKFPNNEDILVIIAKLKLQFNKLNEAKNLYEQILKINPQNHDAYIVLGNISIENKKPEEALKIFSKMSKELPNSYSSHFFLGKIYVQKRDFNSAEREFLKTIELKNELTEPRFELISIYKSRLKKIGSKLEREKTGVKKLYEEILELDKDNIKASIGLPLYLYKSGEKSKASQMLINFGQKYQDNDEIMMSMAKELVSSENRDDAIIIFNELLKEPNDNSVVSNINKNTINKATSIVKPDKSSIHYLAGLTFDTLKDTQRAISHFMKVSPKSEQYKKSLFHTAYIYNQSGQNDKAVKLLESTFSQFPKDVEFINYLSAFYEENNQLYKALALLKQGLEYAPDDTELLFRIGIIFDKLGDKDGSIAEMKKVIELDPENSSALNYLGYTYAELGINLDKAEELIKKALSIKPEDGYITDSLGWVYYKKGDYDKAVEILEKAAILSSEDPVILEHLGDAYKEKKSYLKAIEAYKKILKKSENRDSVEKKIYDLQILLKKE